MSEVNKPGSDDGEVIPLSDHRRHLQAPRDIAESEEYPTLQNVLLKYFPQNLPNGKQLPDRTAEFLEKYATYGEDSAEFDGLADELRHGIKRPRTVTPMVNEVLGVNLDPMEMRDQLISLLDQITGKGEYADDDPVEKAKSDGERPPPQVLLDYWLYRRVSLPGGLLPGKSAPIWQVWLAGVVIAAVGIVITNVFEPSGWLTWFPRALIAIGIVIFALTSVAMWGLRGELLAPEKEKRRDEAKEKVREKREERKETRKRWRNMFQE